MSRVKLELRGALKKKVERIIKSGCASSVSEVVRIALERLPEPAE